MAMETMQSIRDRMVPMLEVTRKQYRQRVPMGYPLVVDDVERGIVGIEIDPSHALYVTSEEDGVFAEVYRRSPRTDNRASAGRQKPAGVPFSDRRPLVDSGDQALRNLVAELMSYFNQQPGLLYITDE